MKPIIKLDPRISWSETTNAVDAIYELFGTHLKKVKEIQQRDRNGIVYGPIRKDSFKRKEVQK